jgi:hypothetical protein
VQPVGADDQAEGPGRRVLEPDPHAAGALFQAGDRITEQILGGVPGRRVEDRGQVAAQDLDVASEDVGRHVRHRPVLPVDDGGGRQVGLPGLDRVQDAHLGQHTPVGSAAEVDRVAAAAQLRCPLHHRGMKAVTAQPPGEGGPGDAGAGDQDVSVGVHGPNHTDV